MKPTVTFTKTNSDGNLLILTATEGCETPSGGWQIIAIPWYRRLWWIIRNLGRPVIH